MPQGKTPLTKQTNILAFNDAAKRANARPSVAPAKGKRPSVKVVAKAPASKKAAPKAEAPKKVAAPKKTTTPKKVATPKKAVAPKKTAKSQAVEAKKTQGATTPAAQQRAEHSPAAEKKSSRLDTLKRTARKAKADKVFEARYADTNKSSAESAAGSRAALYKGQMGTTQKRSARMQQQAQPSGSAKSFKRVSVREKLRSPKAIGAAIIVACLALSCVFLYPAAKDFYLAVRQQAQVQAEYAALEQRNTAIQAEVDRLSTSEGIEDKAREEFGWVKAGENSVSVHGLEEETAINLNADVAEKSIAAPATWYSPILDALFAVNTSSAAGK
ncbi:MAG: septum formation initiator family protein [Raoultibacter sp.]